MYRYVNTACRLCNDNTHRRRYLRTRIRDLPGRSSRRRECAYVALSAMKLRMQLRAMMQRNDADSTHHGDRRRLGSAETTPGAEVAIIMSYLRPIPSRICHSPLRTIPPRLKINYDSIAVTKNALLSARLNPCGFPCLIREYYNTG